jgi:diguanylate cyclase (GGDEF)-like protein
MPSAPEAAAPPATGGDPALAILAAARVEDVASALAKALHESGHPGAAVAWSDGMTMGARPAAVLDDAIGAVLGDEAAPSADVVCFCDDGEASAYVVLPVGVPGPLTAAQARLTTLASRRLVELFRLRRLESSVDALAAAEKLQRALFAVAGLAEANAVLQERVRERERAQHLQETLYRIAALTSTDESSDDFYRHIHQAVGELLYADNFYIALLSADGTRLEFPYAVDTGGGPPNPRPLGRGLSEYVIRHGRTLLADTARVQALVDEGEVEPTHAFSSTATSWLGAPLFGRDDVTGVIAVQSYRDDVAYGPADAELLEFVAYQVASSLQRRAHDEELQRLNAELERRVEQRTRELSDEIRVREQVEAQLKHQVMHDPLTGLPNRLYLGDRLARAIAAHRRDPTRRFALMYLDIDRFKVFNDSLGHLAGDELLCEVARRLGECVREPDVVARLSGDEFAVLLENAPSQLAACRIARRIQASLQRPMTIGDRDLRVTASIGIARSEPRHDSIDAVLHDADIALYRAKAAGRQCFVLFDDSLQRDALDVLDLEQQLRAGLARGEFEVHFQPIVRLADATPVGHEALVRWRHPERGLLAPAEFLGVAEESGLIEAIDWATYRAACSALRTDPSGGYVTINLSTRHFRHDDFDRRLLALVAETGCDPRRLRIEVTEGTLLGDTEAVVRTLGRLRDAGVEAALDDFGTGYSSLGYVHRFPLRMLKIDRSFVTPLADAAPTRSAAIVGAVLTLTRALELEVVAEGVENDAQRAALLAMGCTFGQGWLFGKPAPWPAPGR